MPIRGPGPLLASAQGYPNPPLFGPRLSWGTFSHCLWSPDKGLWIMDTSGSKFDPRHTCYVPYEICLNRGCRTPCVSSRFTNAVLLPLAFPCSVCLYTFLSPNNLFPNPQLLFQLIWAFFALGQPALLLSFFDFLCSASSSALTWWLSPFGQEASCAVLYYKLLL